MQVLENTTIYGSITAVLPEESVWPASLAWYAVTAGVVNFEGAEFINSSRFRSLSQADLKSETPTPA